MPEEITDEALEEIRAHNDKLRDDIAKAESKSSENEANRLRELEAMKLAAETARLEGRLNAAQEQAKVSTSKTGASSLMDNAKEALVQAALVAEQTVGPVDTNAEAPAKSKTGATTAVEGGVVTTAPDGTLVVNAPKNEKAGGNQ